MINLLFAVVGLAALYYLSTLLLGIYMVRLFVKPKVSSLDFARQSGLEEGEFSEEDLQSYGFIPFETESEYGYTLKGVYSPGTEPKKTMIFVHGHTWNWYGQVKYMPHYRDRGFNIITYCHRYHGDSGGADCTGGFFEKHDLRRIAEKAKELFPETETLGLMGESMGAATVLQGMETVEGLSFVHADCPYSDLPTLFSFQMELKGIPRLFRKRVLASGQWYLRHRFGFDLDDVSPRRSVQASDVPVLLMHGDADDYVPASMSEAIKEARPENTTLVMISGAIHAKGIMKDPDAYDRAVKRFLDKVC